MGIEEKPPRKRTLKVHGNPWKRNQITGEIPISNEPDNGGEYPDTLPDGTPLLSRSEMMERYYKNAGEPLKGAKDD